MYDLYPKACMRFDEVRWPKMTVHSIRALDAGCVLEKNKGIKNHAVIHEN